MEILAPSPRGIVGIDPGIKGALVLISPAGELLRWRAMPCDIRVVVDWLLEISPSCVYLEKAQSFPKQGVSSAFNYGKHYGEISGILKCIQLEFCEVAPITWTKEMHRGITGKSPKHKSVECFRRLCPKWRDLKHDGAIDAFLIAEYGRRLKLR